MKFKVGDEVRVVTFKFEDDGIDYSGNPEGMTGQITDMGPYPEWPYKVELNGADPKLFYPSFYAEAELEAAA